MKRRHKKRKHDYITPITIPNYIPLPAIQNDFLTITLPGNNKSDFDIMRKFVPMNVRIKRSDFPDKLTTIEEMENEILNTAETALIGEQAPTNDKGIHPGIKFGGPVGTILVPFAVYIYKFIKKKLKKRTIEAQTSFMNNMTKNIEETTDAISNTVTTQIRNTGSTVVNHIKGKITEAGKSIVDDLKTQAIAQEDIIINNIKATILEQEKLLADKITTKFIETGNSITKDVKRKFWIFGQKSTKNNVEVKRRLSEEISNNIQDQISDNQTGLLPEIEKQISQTNNEIMENIKTHVPENQIEDKVLNNIQTKMNSMYEEVKNFVGESEKFLIDDVQNEINQFEPQPITTNEKITDEEDKPHKSLVQKFKEKLSGKFFKSQKQETDDNCVKMKGLKIEEHSKNKKSSPIPIPETFQHHNLEEEESHEFKLNTRESSEEKTKSIEENSSQFQLSYIPEQFTSMVKTPEENEEITDTRIPEYELSNLPSNIHKLIGDDRKQSMTPTISETSAFSSRTFNESNKESDGTPSFVLPNFDKLRRKKKFLRRNMKSLDSGTLHYYGEYLAIAFPLNESQERENGSGGTSSESTLLHVSSQENL